MKKILFFFLFPAWLFAQTSSLNKITFRAGETPVIAIKAPPGAMEVTFRNSLGRELKKFTTADSTITKASDSVYVFGFSNVETIGKEGRGTWQAELKIAGFGIRKMDVYPYEIYKATTVTTNTTPVSGTPYNYLFTWDFGEITPSVSLIESGTIVVNGASVTQAMIMKAGYVAVDSYEDMLALPLPSSVIIVKVANDEVQAPGKSTRYEVWPDGSIFLLEAVKINE